MNQQQSQPPRSTTSKPHNNHNLRITVNDAVGRTDKVMGSVHVPRNYLVVAQEKHTKIQRRRHVHLRLMGREVVVAAAPPKNSNNNDSHSNNGKDPTTTTTTTTTAAEHVFWEKGVSWDLLNPKKNHSTNDGNDNDSDDSWIRLDFALSIPHDLPPSIDETTTTTTTTNSNRNTTTKKNNNNHGSKFRVEYVLHAMLMESGTILLDQSCMNPPLRIPRTQRFIYQPTHKKLTLQFDKTFPQFQPILCGLWEHKTETFSLQVSTTTTTTLRRRQQQQQEQEQPNNSGPTTTTPNTTVRWCPTQQSEVIICLTDPQKLFYPSTFSTFGHYRLECRLEQRIEWQEPAAKDGDTDTATTSSNKNNNNLPVNVEESSWTLKPALYWKGGGSAAAANTTAGATTTITTTTIVDGEMVLPVDGVRESYPGQLVRIEHSVTFLVHQKTMGTTQWQRLATSPRVPVQIEL